MDEYKEVVASMRPLQGVVTMRIVRHGGEGIDGISAEYEFVITTNPNW